MWRAHQDLLYLVLPVILATPLQILNTDNSCWVNTNQGLLNLSRLHTDNTTVPRCVSLVTEQQSYFCYSFLHFAVLGLACLFSHILSLKLILDQRELRIMREAHSHGRSPA